MRRTRLLWQLYPSYLLITLVALTAVAWLATRSLHTFYNDLVRSELQLQAQLLAEELDGPLAASNAAELQRTCERFARIATSPHGEPRLTVIVPSGRVLCDTEENPESMDNHAERPEVRAALAGEVGDSRRFSTTLDQAMVYVAIPVRRDGEVAGVVRASVSAATVEAEMAGIRRRLISGGLLIAGLVALVSLLVSRRITRPLEQMRHGAERFARGQLNYRLETPNSVELAALAEALNEMAGELQRRIRTIERQHNEQEAVLASMAEGVLAVDVDEKVISINRMAARLLDCDEQRALHRGVLEIVRHPDLRSFIAYTLTCERTVEQDIDSHGEPGRVLQARGTPLHGEHGEAVGAVIVLNDVTNLRRLENIRRDFVANVSHELKTPIASIKGFVETLLDGARHDPADSERFLRIVVKQADRLNHIIEDLLSLSKIEQSEKAGDIDLEQREIDDIIQAAIDECHTRAEERQIRVEMAGERRLSAKMNPALLEQAVVNLLDNAIKYSEPERAVTIATEQSNGSVRIMVRDQGYGIGAEHLPRLFERFYRVDKARSRKAGGTGLGLAIVKHIVQVHGGSITVDSTPGTGSTFTIHLKAR